MWIALRKNKFQWVNEVWNGIEHSVNEWIYKGPHFIFATTRAATESCTCRSWEHLAEGVSGAIKLPRPDSSSHVPQWSTSYLEAGETPFYSLLKII